MHTSIPQLFARPFVPSPILPALKANPGSIARRLALILVIACSVLTGVRAQDAVYFGIKESMEQADALSAAGDRAKAHAKYREAHAELTQLKRNNPVWNTKLVSFRLKQLEEKIVATAEPPAARAEDGGGADGLRGPSRGAPEVRLLTEGAEPRETLRLQPEAGSRQTMEMTIGMEMTMGVAGQDLPEVKIPAMSIKMDATVKEVADNGDITYDLAMVDATLAAAADAGATPGVAEAMKGSLSKLRGHSGGGVISNRGLVRKTDLRLPATADAQTRQTLDQLKEVLNNATVPLPTEPVGLGAQWEYRTEVESQGMTIDQTTTYLLVAMEDDQIRLEITITQEAANQKIEIPAMPGLKVDMNRMTTRGHGRTTQHLGRLLPQNGSIQQESEMAMSIPIGPQKQAMTVNVDLDMTLKSE